MYHDHEHYNGEPPRHAWWASSAARWEIICAVLALVIVAGITGGWW